MDTEREREREERERECVCVIVLKVVCVIVRRERTEEKKGWYTKEKRRGRMYVGFLTQ